MTQVGESMKIFRNYLWRVF